MINSAITSAQRSLRSALYAPLLLASLIATGCQFDGDLGLNTGGGGTYIGFDSEIPDMNLALDSFEYLVLGNAVLNAAVSDFSASSSDEGVAVVTPSEAPEGDEGLMNVYFKLTGVGEGNATITLTLSGDDPRETSFNVTVTPSAELSFVLPSYTIVEGSRAWAVSEHQSAEGDRLEGDIAIDDIDLNGLLLSQSDHNQVELTGVTAGDYTISAPFTESQVKVVALSDITEISIQSLSSEERFTSPTDPERPKLSLESSELLTVWLKADDWFYAPEFIVEEGAAPVLKLEVDESSAEICTLESYPSKGYLFAPFNYSLSAQAAGDCKLKLSLGDLSEEFTISVE
jgi:hypothetical protein